MLHLHGYVIKFKRCDGLSVSIKSLNFSTTQPKPLEGDVARGRSLVLKMVGGLPQK